MDRDRYLPEGLSPAQAGDVVVHARNKTVLVDFAYPSFRERAIRWLWYRLGILRHSALARSGLAVVLSERLIEDALLLREVDGTVLRALDFGGFESTLPLTLATLGVEVTVVDQRRYPFVHERVHVVQHDILRPLEGMAKDFDLVYSISTIEHVGLGAYGDPRAPNGDELAIAHLWERVRPGGRLFFSVPAGLSAEQRGYRVYDPQAVERLMPAPGQVRYFLKRGRHGVWRESRSSEVAKHRYEAYYAQAPAEGVAVVMVRKPAG